MRRRTRLLAGTFALVAMTLGLAETVIAASCMPCMEMGAAEVSAMDMQTPEAPAGHHDHGVPTDGDPTDGDPTDGDPTDGDPTDGDPADGDDRDCPFGPTVVQGCAGAASLPAYAAHGVASQGALSSSVSIELARQDLLLVTALFYPPRA